LGTDIFNHIRPAQQTFLAALMALMDIFNHIRYHTLISLALHTQQAFPVAVMAAISQAPPTWE
jgi:hypothetical protein